MDWLDLLYDILKVCIIPMLGILTTFTIKWLRAKEVEVLNKVESDIGDKYISMAFETIRDCVSATTQTYVDTLKKQGTFDEQAQKIAFDMTFKAVMSVLTEDTKEYLTEAYGDLTIFITNKIEAEVKAQK